MESTPGILWAVKIADYLEESLDELVGREPKDPKPEIRRYARRIHSLAGGADPPPQKKAAKRKRKTKKKGG